LYIQKVNLLQDHGRWKETVSWEEEFVIAEKIPLELAILDYAS
jgi:hypothetical protein